MTYEELQEALRVFHLPERASLAEIKARHRRLVKEFHPDAEAEGDGEQIRRINQAYRVLTEYCTRYRLCFSREEFLLQYPEERLREQFGVDPVWGGKSSKK